MTSISTRASLGDRSTGTVDRAGAGIERKISPETTSH
jgi:hypothetical protein